MPALYPASSDSSYNLWRKILTNQAGAIGFTNGQSEHVIKKNVLRNQGGTYSPNSTDQERTTLAKILRNQVEAIEGVCSSIPAAGGPSSNDTETTVLAKILRNMEAANSYTLGISDVPILRLILRNMATAIDGGGTIADIQKVLGNCPGASPPTPPEDPMKLVLPLVTEYALRVGAITSDVRFKGTVTIFNDGHYEFDGEAAGYNAADQFSVWVGSSPTVGAYVDLFLTGASAFIPVSASVTPAEGEKVYLIAGDKNNVGYLQHVLAFDYPDGLILPMTWVLGTSIGNPTTPGGAYIIHSLDRSGNDINSDFEYVANSTIASLFFWNAYNLTTLVEGGFGITYNAAGSTDRLDPFTTDADNNIGLTLVSILQQTGTNQRWGLFKIGPFIRTPPVPIPV